MKSMCPAHKVSALLVLVGALNWGLVGGFGYNLVNALLGNWPMVERVVYILVGLSALGMLLMGKCKMCGCCGDKNCSTDGKGCNCGTGHGNSGMEQKM